ncbi:MAG: L-glutamate gamma-semialdehyde dehydrogenase [Gammaproteobacteria bacterium]|nr:L-glutamate gamma-semialdehyde dehydrogenase [Gammaproteobacteria bacterium]MBU6510175.1 L-glutamate gamma-semialdehyde dehydrogenase [Gammaproteobacteria bacterium]MDE1983930.1 L-glutamate gamma-semialdehyde dehydrogenase [Gammaproteobacteria bacterium]MDE2108089.1 L-glutamate gamma-semialdehyde dehydrogenase [Gammaproteobacteria bacterium]
MSHASARVPMPANEPVLAYAPGSPERTELKKTLARMAAERIEIPLIIGGQPLHTGKLAEVRMPHDHGQVLASFHQAEAPQLQAAIEAALAAKPAWEALDFTERAAIFLRAADLLATRYRPILNASTMLGQSKTVHQAEIDAACELIDFLRFNVAFAERLLAEQPNSAALTWNQLDYRALDGFVYAATPFNFTSIAGNLPTSPALMGNTVVFKPSPSAMFSNWYFVELLREAGLPSGVINLVQGDPAMITAQVLSHPDLGGVHFTGSTAVFKSIWRTVGENMAKYHQYPRLVGETGGKDFIFAHASAGEELEALAVAMVRGAFEYQGQKCSAPSRAFIPASLWPKLRERVVALTGTLKMGDVQDFRNFMGAVIHEAAFKKISGYLEYAKNAAGVKILTGGKADGKRGWFIEPTVIQSEDPKNRLMCEEIFGPVITVHVYPDAAYEDTLRLCDQSTPYALTGSIFARERSAIATASQLLRHAAGNFYINDKPTGAVVGQQPFGGSRASGTNDKAGSFLNLVRWTSPRVIKENFVPPTAVGYPFQGAE